MRIWRTIINWLYKRTFSNEISIEVLSFSHGENKATYVDTVKDLFSDSEFYIEEKLKHKIKGFLKFDRTYALHDTILNMGFLDRLNNSKSKNLNSFLKEHRSLVVNINDKSQFTTTAHIFSIKKVSGEWVLVN